MSLPLIFIVGPTAIGKSKFAIKLAKYIKGEIINADSMQVYSELNILTSRPSDKDNIIVPHHLYGYISGAERYNFFVDRRAEKKISSNLKITDDKISKTSRTIERSLRSIVKVNSEQIKLPITDEEKSLQLLARQQ